MREREREKDFFWEEGITLAILGGMEKKRSNVYGSRFFFFIVRGLFHVILNLSLSLPREIFEECKRILWINKKKINNESINRKFRMIK